MGGGGLLLNQLREESRLAAFTILPGAGSGLHRIVDGGKELGAVTFEGVHGSGPNETFDHAAVDGGEIHPFAEVVDGAERCSGFAAARFDDGIDGGLTNVLDRAQAKSN